MTQTPTRTPPAPAPAPVAAAAPARRRLGLAKQRLRELAGRASDLVAVRLRPHLLRLPGRRAVLVAGSTEWVRHYLAGPGSATPIRSLTLAVAWWRAPAPGWSGRLGALAEVAEHQFRLPRGGRGPARVAVRLTAPRALGEAATALLAVLDPVVSDPAVLDRAVPRILSPGDGLLVDARLINPRGRRPESYARTARLTPVRLDPRSLSAVHRSGRFTYDPALFHGHADAHARWLVGVAAAGGVVSAPDLPAAVADLLAPELRALVAAPAPADPFAAELRSVATRRAALRDHSGLGPLPPVSAIVVSHRATHLDTIIAAIAGQTYPELEIVLGLHGVELTAAELARLRGHGRPLHVVAAPAAVSFGEAMGLATAHARGRLITKFDDDDTYGPEHVWDLVLARHYSGATLVGKGAEFVHLEAAGITVRRSSGRPESPAAFVAGGTMLLARADLEAVGGWRPVPRSVDHALFERLHRAGAQTYRTHPFGYIYHRRPQGHTWAAGDEYFLRTASARWTGLPAHREFGVDER